MHRQVRREAYKMDTRHPVVTEEWRLFPDWVEHEQDWFVLSDTHGRSYALKALLEKRGPGERLIHLGDLGDRGRDSMGVFEIIDRENGAVLVQGNHDLMLRFALLEESPLKKDAMEMWLYNDGSSTMKGMRKYMRMQGRTDSRLPLEVPAFVRRVIAGQVPYFEDGSLLFVHAGVDPADPDGTLAMPACEAVNLESGQADSHYTWIREPFLEAHGPFTVHGRKRFIIHGHTAVNPDSAWAVRPWSLDCDLLCAQMALEIRGRKWRRHIMNRAYFEE